MDLTEEKELIERARKDPNAFGELYDQYYSRIFGYVLKRVANIEVAQDITSEVFFKALRNLWRFRWQNIPFSFWLYRVATNEVTDYFRRDKHRIFSLEEISDPIVASNPSVEAEILEAEEELKRHEDFLLLHQSISKLPIKYQEAITLRYFESKPIKEIAEILGRREGTIKSWLRRGLERLRDLTE